MAGNAISDRQLFHSLLDTFKFSLECCGVTPALALKLPQIIIGYSNSPPPIAADASEAVSLSGCGVD